MAPPDGYQELVTDQTPALFRRALLLSHDWHLAEDLVQETALSALTRWRKVSAADEPAAYLQTMLTNLFLSRTRRRSYSEVVTEIEVPSTVDPWPGIELEIQVAQGLAVLNPNERAVVVGRYLDDLPASEVAKQLGRNESWVRVTAHRALTKMRGELDAAAEATSATTPGYGSRQATPARAEPDPRGSHAKGGFV